MSSFLAARALLQEGVPKKEIARRLGIDRRTVRKYAKRCARGDQAPVRDAPLGKLHPVLDRVQDLVERNLSAVQILRELKAIPEVPSISYSTVQRFVRQMRPLEVSVFSRLSFAPGEEAQVDFADAGRVSVGGRPRQLWLFVLTLCYSRRSYYDLVLDQKVPSFLGCLRRGFEFFGGAPLRIKPDNLKSAVLISSLGERHYQPDFFRFCKHYGCVPDAARPRTPTDKGRVERDVGYVKTSWLRGKSFASIEAALDSLRAWHREVADVRMHGTTRRRPIDLFEEEKGLLRPLPHDPYEIATFGTFRVRKDCHVHVLGNHYSVPHRLVGTQVMVRIADQRIQIFAENQEVAAHSRLTGIGQTCSDTSHYPVTKRIPSQEIHRQRLLLVRGAGPHAASVVACLRAGPHVFADQLARLARLVGHFGPANVDAACRRALHFQAADSALRIEVILDRGLQNLDLTVHGEHSKSTAQDFGRPLHEYSAILEGVFA